MTKLDPIVKVVLVSAGQAEAFERFTAGMSAWWPLVTHSVWGSAAETVRFESGVGGRIVEVHEDGRESVWGSVELWDPPSRLGFTWHPGRQADTAQRIDVEFAAESGGTRVRLVHGGWETLRDDAAGTRTSYDSGWELVLGRFTGAVESAPSS